MSDGEDVLNKEVNGGQERLWRRVAVYEGAQSSRHFWKDPVEHC